MKLKLALQLLAATLLVASAGQLPAQTPAPTASKPPAAVSPATAELKALTGRVIEKLKAGQREESDFGPELKTFDDLIAKYSTGSPDDAAQILYMKAMLYLQVFENPDKATPLVEQLKRDYPATKSGKSADRLLAYIQKKQASLKTQSGLKAGLAFPDFSVKDLNGNPLSVGALKGKVVLVDFWATWCGPCRGELPNVIDIYKKNHPKGFEIIGVSLDSEKEKLTDFLKSQDGMTWSQYFDGQGWQNALAQKYGVESIPFTILVGTDGKIIGTELRGEELAGAVEKALK
jgi:thiol-disulfide isomerase/thioredoxin